MEEITKPKQPIEVWLMPIERYIRAEATAGVILLISTVAAIVWANSGWHKSYFELWDNHLAVSLGSFKIDKSLHHWINDGLMAMFFFVVGLELKREIIGGELSDFRKARLPIMAAIGGMITPALIFVAFNSGSAKVDGWGIPMATDIAFALGVVSLLGKRVPASVKIFITALAIADDLGAVLVIAFFYTSDISFLNLAFGILYLGILIAANAFGVRSTLFYGLVGIGGVWLAFLLSGVHATIAGVLAAFAMPARARIDERSFVRALEERITEFRNIPSNDVTLLEPAQYNAIQHIYKLSKDAGTPLQQLEHQLHPWVAFLVMPLFAFANAGVQFSAGMFKETLFESITLGIISALVAGKLLGVVGTCWLTIKFGWAALPPATTMRHIIGVGFLAGIGFTMSLFITNLAYESEPFVMEAKLGIFVASLVAGTLGYFVLRSASRNAEKN